MAPKQMSLEAALDEEAREIRALLEGRKSETSPPPLPSPSATTTSRARTASPAGKHQSPARGLLADLAPGIQRSDHQKAQRAASVSGDGRSSSAVSSPSGSTFSEPPRRSMLDIDSPPASAGLPRTHRASHGSVSPSLPTIHQGLPSPGRNIESAYQFEMLPSIESHALPKRVSQGEGMFHSSKKKAGAMSSVFGNGPDGRPKGAKSRSPAPRHNARSLSPAHPSLGAGGPHVTGTPGSYVSDSGKVINLDQAYRRLSDAALLRSGGVLAELPTKNAAHVKRGEELAPDGGVRLTKDYNDEEEAVDSSDEDESAGSSGDEMDRQRGRARARKDSDPPESPRQAQSLLAAAEEERKDVASGNRVKSLLDVSVSSPGLSADQLFSKKLGKPVIHPRTSFDVGAGGASGVSTPVDSEEEQTRSDFNTAQKMALTLSPIHSSPEAHRCIRQILRGDFRKYQAEAEQGLRRQRMYLVATDLSEEAAYALEWTIGTVLRDGDTLLAVYAVDEEVGTGGDVSGTTSNSVAIGEGPNQMKEAAAIVRTLSNQQGLVVPGEVRGKASTDGRRSLSNARTMSMGRYKDKFESERYHATEEITERCIKLLRKTKLQARIVVEVFHCKSPKHMITEVIDYLEPTLVILGSRGRSALKGVLLGSFSNYLVTKSSVPVMVARKKLRKHSKLKRSNLRLSNMLQTPGSKLESAVIDRPSMGMRRSSLT
ncbi:hypothetical protein, variant [Verruconis gallopava]|uniref:UspA domain-containing protein n=1 Tax=Verruconis gallopava TaxID=253628 RepID=A0A0D2A1M1_9PEZI|nr:uncharacterized protein PV09_07801 [Verruconis gallopava]XP_016210473.1 hypothetical protein, variant [Verruconis gallopava]KIW00603.1 hypothetical protein PV09_07801 [Verruconis gallopava]KIW00604.1 hypothetical protein, variant [Verruconis gallopava]